MSDTTRGPGQRLREWVFGPPKDPHTQNLFHHLSLVAFFAWVGLGADGLRSSRYGPEEAFLALGRHYHLALLIALAIGVTVTVIAASYSQIVELFPSGGGGHTVATHAFVIIYGIASHAGMLPEMATASVAEIRSSHLELGTFGLLVLLLRAYSLGAGTYTGIEAISNSMRILREPKVQTAKRTMRYMAASLALTAMGLMVAYVLFQVGTSRAGPSTPRC